MSDLISRKETIRAIDSLGEDYISYYKLLMLIGKLPSAEPEQTAKFRRDGDFLRCSKCQWIVDSGYNYCPHCGAKLDWSDDE